MRERHNRRKGSGRCEGGERAGWGGVKWGRVCIDSIQGRSAYKEPGSDVVAKELMKAGFGEGLNYLEGVTIY